MDFDCLTPDLNIISPNMFDDLNDDLDFNCMFDNVTTPIISSTKPNEMGITSETRMINTPLSPIFETKETKVTSYLCSPMMFPQVPINGHNQYRRREFPLLVQKRVPKLNLSQNVSLNKKKLKNKETTHKPTRRVRRVKKKNVVEESEKPNEMWIVTYDEEVGIKDISITCKTRCEEPCPYVPCVLYSSLKYELRVLCQSAFNDKTVPFYLARCKVVHAENFNEIIKNGKTVIKGDCEQALTKITKGGSVKFDGKMKVQFTDVSYHHKKHNFRFEVHLYLPSDLQNAVFIMRSGEFKVFARKPSKIGKKRKRSCLKSFENKLGDMMRSAKRLKPNEKKKAYEMVSKKLYELDPDYFNFLGELFDEQ